MDSVTSPSKILSHFGSRNNSPFFNDSQHNSSFAFKRKQPHLFAPIQPWTGIFPNPSPIRHSITVRDAVFFIIIIIIIIIMIFVLAVKVVDRGASLNAVTCFIALLVIKNIRHPTSTDTSTDYVVGSCNLTCNPTCNSKQQQQQQQQKAAQTKTNTKT
jgi:hypothetical protein